MIKQNKFLSNRALGSLMYRIIYLGLLYLGIKLVGNSILHNSVLIFVGAFSFEIVGFILRTTGFWKY